MWGSHYLVEKTRVFDSRAATSLGHSHMVLSSIKNKACWDVSVPPGKLIHIPEEEKIMTYDVNMINQRTSKSWVIKGTGYSAPLLITSNQKSKPLKVFFWFNPIKTEHNPHVYSWMVMCCHKKKKKKNLIMKKCCHYVSKAYFRTRWFIWLNHFSFIM